MGFTFWNEWQKILILWISYENMIFHFFFLNVPVQHSPGYCEKIVATCINIIIFYRRDIRHSRQSRTCFNSVRIRTGPDLSVSEAAPIYTGCLDLFCFQHWEKPLSVWLYACFDPIPKEENFLSSYASLTDLKWLMRSPNSNSTPLDPLAPSTAIVLRRTLLKKWDAAVRLLK